MWSAYLAIPLVLGFFLQRRKDLPFRGIFLLFGAFIFACGTTHLMEAIIFWWPAYRLAGVIKLITEIISWTTVRPKSLSPWYLGSSVALSANSLFLKCDSVM